MIYRKMMEKGKPFDLVRDLRAVRLIVKDIPACYIALGVIHTHWRPIPNEFDDYIAAPKDNYYQSLHTAVIYDDGKSIEVQIRTGDMHQNAEFGIAAHWRYKERGKKDEEYEQRINWLRKLMEWRQEVQDAQEFVDGMKTDVFQDRVYVFTPRGDIIDLPAGSTPIDFAYHVHTEIGHRCRGAKINGKLVTLEYNLHTGDQVEILTSKQGGPSRDWLNPNLGLVRTASARGKIRNWFKRQDREQNLAQGKAMLERELQRLGLPSLDEPALVSLANLHDRSVDDFYVALGCGDVTIGRVLNKILETKGADDSLVVVPPTSQQTSSDAISVLGLKGLMTTTARCCNPTPGDQIVGYITRGHGATIHRQDCPNILRIRDRERLVKVSWGQNIRTYPVPIRISAYDRQGLMGDITTLLNSESVNIIDVQVRVRRAPGARRLPRGAQLDVLRGARDAAALGEAPAAASGDPGSALADAVDRLAWLDALDPSAVEVPEAKPIAFKDGREPGLLLAVPFGSRAEAASREDVDLLVGGSVREASGYFLVELWAWDAARGAEVFAWRDAATRGELYERVADAGRGLAGVLLGRPWASLEVAADPPGASVLVDGNPPGTGRSRFDDLAPGRHEIRVSAPGYREETRTVDLEPGSATSVGIALASMDLGTIDVTSEPPGADAWLDAVWQGRTPLDIPRPGERVRLVVSLPDGPEAALTVGPSSPARISFSLSADVLHSEAEQKAARDRFYGSFGWFMLSLPVPFYSYSWAVDWTAEAYRLEGGGNAAGAARAAGFGLGFYYAYLGGLGVSAALAGWTIYNLVRYVRAADRTPGQGGRP